MSEQKETVPTHPSQEDGSEQSSPHSEEHPSSIDEHDGHFELSDFEPESVDSGIILGVVLATAVVVVGLVILGFTIFNVYSRKTAEELVAQTTYPEIRDIRAAATGELNQSGVVDAENEIYRIPIDRAMSLMVEQQYTAEAGDFTGEVILKRSE